MFSCLEGRLISWYDIPAKKDEKIEEGGDGLLVRCSAIERIPETRDVGIEPTWSNPYLLLHPKMVGIAGDQPAPKGATLRASNTESRWCGLQVLPLPPIRWQRIALAAELNPREWCGKSGSNRRCLSWEERVLPIIRSPRYGEARRSLTAYRFLCREAPARLDLVHASGGRTDTI